MTELLIFIKKKWQGKTPTSTLVLISRVNATTEDLKNRAEAVLYGLDRVEKAQAGEPLDFDLIKVQLDEIDVLLSEIKPKVDEVLDLADKTELISSAPHTYSKGNRLFLG